jgi:hypothetical protein
MNQINTEVTGFVKCLRGDFYKEQIHRALKENTNHVVFDFNSKNMIIGQSNAIFEELKYYLFLTLAGSSRIV